VTTRVLKAIQDTIESTRIQMTVDEAYILWPKIKEFVNSFKREPSLQAADPLEVRMAQAIITLKDEKRRRMANGQG
jgi:hypothetical protein